jgi:CRISPR type I-E-associated protein CasB/Cse2
MEDASTIIESSSEPTVRRPGLAAVVRRLQRHLSQSVDAGDLARLRRLSPSELASPAFWKVAVAVLVPAGKLESGGGEPGAREARWAAITSMLARLTDVARPGWPLGRALAKAGYSELRLVILLKARGHRLADVLRQLAQFLASRGQPVDPVDIARLILLQKGASGSRLRSAIARDYYSNLSNDR